jgi:hypothetical protein
MRFRATTAFLKLYLVVAGLALSCLATGTTFAQRGQKIEFSSPQSGVVVSNLNHLGTKQPGLKQLEEDLSRPFESLNPDSSLGPVIVAPSRPPPLQPTIQSKREKEREKELEDLRKNWAFVNPDEVTKGPTPERVFGVKEYEKNGEEKKSLSVLEKYFQNSAPKPGGEDEQVDNSFGKKENDGLDPLRSTDRWETLDGSAHKSGQSLKGLFGSNLDGRTAPRSATLSGLPNPELMNVGGLQNSRPTPEQERMDALRDQYKQLLGPRSALPATGSSLYPLNPQVDPARALPNPAKSLDPFSSPTKQDPLNPFQNAINPTTAFQPPIFQDMNSRAFGQPGLPSSLLPTPPPKAQPPPANFSFPTRKF